MNVAIYYGSFDPFHENHNKLIQHVLNNYNVNSVIIVPNYGGSSKGKQYEDIDHRLQMIHLRTNGLIIELSNITQLDTQLHPV